MPKYSVTAKVQAQIEAVFRHHAPSIDQIQRFAGIRAGARDLAILIAGETPSSREQTLALTHLEEAMMFATAAIARNEEAWEPDASAPLENAGPDLQAGVPR